MELIVLLFLGTIDVTKQMKYKREKSRHMRNRRTVESPEEALDELEVEESDFVQEVYKTRPSE